MGMEHRRLYGYHLFVSIFVLHILIRDVSSKAMICRKVRDSFPYEETARFIMERDDKKCPPTVTPISIYQVTSTSQELADTTDLMVCWSRDIRRFALHFDNSVQLHDVIDTGNVTSRRRHMRSCDQANDTLYLDTKKHGTKINHMLLTIHTESPANIIAFYTTKSSISMKTTKHILRFKTEDNESNEGK
ncbi:uncharacterized protein LOC127854582 [Dreissena polymorpha]|uniref:uncharacterized protein LOC127854582 n=1 Tax=Dreissena polymorpha TaxID=45954 RepID=UPI002264A98B|nr:uncharacterized protein LOC127854582 [Dreissena polymorpha]